MVDDALKILLEYKMGEMAAHYFRWGEACERLNGGADIGDNTSFVRHVNDFTDIFYHGAILLVACSKSLFRNLTVMDAKGQFKPHHSAVLPPDRPIDAAQPLSGFPVLEFPDLRLAQVLAENQVIRTEFAGLIQPLESSVTFLSYDVLPEHALFGRIRIEDFMGLRISDVHLLINRVEDRNKLVPGLFESLFRFQPLSQLSLGAADPSLRIYVLVLSSHRSVPHWLRKEKAPIRKNPLSPMEAP